MAGTAQENDLCDVSHKSQFVNVFKQMFILGFRLLNTQILAKYHNSDGLMCCKSTNFMPHYSVLLKWSVDFLVL